VCLKKVHRKYGELVNVSRPACRMLGTSAAPFAEASAGEGDGGYEAGTWPGHGIQLDTRYTREPTAIRLPYNFNAFPTPSDFQGRLSAGHTVHGHLSVLPWTGLIHAV
jgi:hypothetical protein